jgi:enoyl-CoA hydratase/carnithine racemase
MGSVALDALWPLAANSSQVVLGRTVGIAHMVLNRPKALNALTTDMIKSITPQLETWAGDDSIKGVIVAGVGKGFCAGGDVRGAISHWIPFLRPFLALYDEKIEHGDSKFDLRNSFFMEEYKMNYAIAQFPKPYCSILDGVTSSKEFSFCFKLF